MEKEKQVRTMLLVVVVVLLLLLPLLLLLLALLLLNYRPQARERKERGESPQIESSATPTKVHTYT